MSPDELLPVAAAVLGVSPERLAELAPGHSFAALGGTSLNAIALVAEAGRRGWEIDLAGLISREALAPTLAAARRLPTGPVAAAADGTRSGCGPDLPPSDPAGHGAIRPGLPGQSGMLHWDERGTGQPYHLLFTADIHGGGGPDRIAATVARLIQRHEALRTSFVRHDGDENGLGRRVDPARHPAIARQRLRAPGGTDLVDLVHRQLAPASTALLSPFRQAPVHFQLTEDAEDPTRTLLSILCHHALLDGWSVGLLLTELATDLAGGILPEPASPELIRAASRPPAVLRPLAERRAAELAGAATCLELPSDLSRPERQQTVGARLGGSLSGRAVQAWRELARAAGVGRTPVLLAAWALLLARRAGATDLLIGVPVAQRHRPGLREVVGYATNLVPVRCRVDDDQDVTGYLRAVADDLTAAIRASDVPFEELNRVLDTPHDQRRAPLVQVVLAPDDDLINRRIAVGEVRLDVHEGHCGGAAFDLVLFLRGDPDQPELVCEYAAAVLTPAEVSELLDALDSTLMELAEQLPEQGPIGAVRSISPTQAARLAGIRQGPPAPPATDLWQLVRAAAERYPEAIAVRDANGATSYQELMAVVSRQAATLARAGVGPGDVVVIAVPRSRWEVVGILAALRLGAAYLGVDPGDPDGRIAEILAIARPSAVLADDEAAERLARLVPAGIVCPVLSTENEGWFGTDGAAARQTGAGNATAGPEPRPDPERLLYLTFTSGSTGRPKGVRVRHRSVVRLVSPELGPAAVCVPGDRMLRISPLAFDLSPIELFGPLTVGGTVEVHPERTPTAAGVARHLIARGITVAWLTAGLFRLVAADQPECFRAMRYVMTGGEAVDPDAVRRVLAASDGVPVMNGYGPSENTTFTTTYLARGHSDLDHQTPIGTPVPGTGVLVLDPAGRPVPPGAVGELVATGIGLAVDYVGDQVATEAGFGRPAPDTGERAYRTGDLVRLDGVGRLRYLGRNDHQVKVGGVRIELDEVRDRLLGCPGVGTATVVTLPRGPSNVVLAAVVPDGPADPWRWREQLATQLPPAALPSLWAILDTLPLTANGKTDTSALAAAAAPLSAFRPPGPPSGTDGAGADGSPPPAGPDRPEDAVGAVAAPDNISPTGQHGWADGIAAAVWCDVLGSPPRAPDSNFFTAGGNSLAMTRMILALKRRHGVVVRPRDFYQDPTPRFLAGQVEMAGSGTATGGRR